MKEEYQPIHDRMLRLSREVKELVSKFEDETGFHVDQAGLSLTRDQYSPDPNKRQQIVSVEVKLT